MLTRNPRLLYPLFIALLVFAVDKIALLPAFQECCTKQGSANSFKAGLNYDFTAEPMIKDARSQGKKLALNFGSSRSFGYYVAPNQVQVEADPYLKPEEKAFLGKWEVVNAAYPGASIITNYVRMYQWLDHLKKDMRPDVLLVEISHFSFNKNSMWISAEIKRGAPYDFVFKYITEMPWTHTRSILGSRVFALSRYRIGEAKLNSSVWEKIFADFTKNTARRPLHMPLHGGSPVGGPGENTPIYFYTASEMQRTMFGNYDIDPNLAKYVYLMLNRARTENIPIVFWRPAVHPMWQRVLDETKTQKKWDRLVRDIRKGGGYYIDMNKTGTLGCNYFKDPVHMDVRCFPELFTRKLKLVFP